MERDWLVFSFVLEYVYAQKHKMRANFSLFHNKFICISVFGLCAHLSFVSKEEKKYDKWHEKHGWHSKNRNENHSKRKNADSMSEWMKLRCNDLADRNTQSQLKTFILWKVHSIKIENNSNHCFAPQPKKKHMHRDPLKPNNANTRCNWIANPHKQELD